ncbi:nuclear mitotic apparatus protein 1 [Lampetra planeri]
MVNGRKSAALISWVNCMCAEKTESLWDLKDLSTYLHIIQTIKASVDVKPLLKSSEYEKGNYIREFLHQFFQKNACLQTVDWDALTVGEHVELELAKLTVAFLCCAVVSTEIQSRMKFLDPDTQIQLHEILKFVMDNEESPQLQVNLELLLNVGCVVRSPGVFSVATEETSGRISSPLSSLPLGHTAGVRFRDLQRIASSSSMNNLLSSPGSPSSPMLSFFDQPAVEVRRLKQQLRQEWEQQEKLEGELSSKSQLLKQSEQEVAELRGRVERLVQLTQMRPPSPLPSELAELHEKTQRLSVTVKQCQELKKENEFMGKRLTQLAEENSELSSKVRESCTHLVECRSLLEESSRSAEQRHTEAEVRIHWLEEALGEALNSKASLEETVRILQGKLGALAEKEASLKEQRNLPPGEVMSEVLQMEEWHMCQKARKRADIGLPPFAKAHTDTTHSHDTPTSSREEQPADFNNVSDQDSGTLIVKDRKYFMPNESTMELEGSMVDQGNVTFREELDGHESKQTGVSQDKGVEATRARSSTLKQNSLEGSSTSSRREMGIARDVQENFELKNTGHRDTLEQGRTLLQQERVALSKERDILERERAALEKERMAVIAMGEGNRSTLMAHMLTTEASMEQQRVILDQEKNTLNLEKAALKAMEDEININLGQQKSRLDQEKRKLEQDMIILKQKWNCVEQEQDKLVKERVIQDQSKASFTKEMIYLKASLEEETSVMKVRVEQERVLLENEREKIIQCIANQKDTASLQRERITMQQEVDVREQARAALVCVVTSLEKIEVMPGNEKGSLICALEEGMTTLKAILGLDKGIACEETHIGMADNGIVAQAVLQQQRTEPAQDNYFKSVGKHGMGHRERDTLCQEKDKTNIEETTWDGERSLSRRESLVSLDESNDVLDGDQADLETARGVLLKAVTKVAVLAPMQEAAAVKDFMEEDCSPPEQEDSDANVRNQKAFTPAETVRLVQANLDHEQIVFRDSLQQEVAVLEQKRTTLTASLEHERNRLCELEQASVSVRMEADSLKAALQLEEVVLRATLNEERTALEEMKFKVQENTLLQNQEKVKLQQDRDLLEDEKVSLEREKVALDRMKATLEEMKAIWERERVVLVAPLEQERVTLKRELAALHQERAKWTTESERLVQEQAFLEQQRVALQQERESLDQHRGNLKVRSEQERAAQSETMYKVEQENARLRTEQRRLEHDMAELRATVDEEEMSWARKRVALDKEKAENERVKSNLDREMAVIKKQKSLLDETMAKFALEGTDFLHQKAMVEKDEEEMSWARKRVALDKEKAENERVKSNLDREMAVIKKQKSLLDQTMAKFALEGTDFLHQKAMVENKSNLKTLIETDCIVLEQEKTGPKQVKGLVDLESATAKQERDVCKAKQESNTLTQRRAAGALSSGIERHSVLLEQEMYDAVPSKLRQAATQNKETEDTAPPGKVNAALKALQDLETDTEIQEMSSPGATEDRKTAKSEIRRENVNSSVDQEKGHLELEKNAWEKEKENFREDEDIMAATMEENLDTTMQYEVPTDVAPSDIVTERDMAPSNQIFTKEECATLQANVSEIEDHFNTGVENAKILSKENLERTPSEDGRRHSMVTRSARKRSSRHSQETLYFTPLQTRPSLARGQAPALDWSLNSLEDLVIDSAKKKPRTSSARRRTMHVIDITLNKKVESCRRDSVSSSVSTMRSSTTTAYELRSHGDRPIPVQSSNWSLGFPASSASFVTLGTFTSQNSLQLEDLRSGRLSDASLRSLPGYRPLGPHGTDGRNLEQLQAPPMTRRRKGNASYYMSCVDEPDPDAEWDELERQGLGAHALPRRQPRAALGTSACYTEGLQENQPLVNCKVDFSDKSDTRNDHLLRQEELQKRNQATLPHLRSCYPLEVETFMPGEDLCTAKPEMTARRMFLRPALADANADMRKRKSGIGHNTECSPESKKSASMCFVVPATPRERPPPRASPRRDDHPQRSWPIIRRLRRSMSRKKSPSSKVRHCN